jgi:ferrochelatase
VFTAHSIPVPMAKASPYVSDFGEASRAVAERLRHSRWSLAYQSRSGRPQDPWLEPDVNDVLAGVAAEGERHAVVVPIGFVCDHVEVLYDLDVEAVTRARERGLTVHRAQAVNAHPDFIEARPDREEREGARSHPRRQNGPGPPMARHPRSDPTSHEVHHRRRRDRGARGRPSRDGAGA